MEPLFTEFFASKNKGTQTEGSIDTQRTYLKKDIIKAIKTPTILEQNYIDIVAFSIDANQTQLAVDLIDGMIKKIGQQDDYKQGSQTYKAVGLFINSYFPFVRDCVDNNLAKTSLKDCSVYGYDSTSFKNKFKGRLRRQSRISGDKTWLPLYFLAKLYKERSDNRFNDWIEDIYKSIYIILNIDAQNEHIKLVDIEYIGICRSGDVFALYMDQWYQVMTSSGYLNQKTEMKIFDDLKKIAIDHVTPIDKTLKTLKLPQLEKISNYIKAFKLNHPQFKGNTLESEAFNKASSVFIESVNLKKLKNELDLISADSHYRLMASAINLQKSNVLEYTKYYTDGEKYYGFIDDNCTINLTEKAIIYHDLDTNGLDVIDETSWNSKVLEPIESVKIPIDKL